MLRSLNSDGWIAFSSQLAGCAVSEALNEHIALSLLVDVMGLWRISDFRRRRRDGLLGTCVYLCVLFLGAGALLFSGMLSFAITRTILLVSEVCTESISKDSHNLGYIRTFDAGNLFSEHTSSGLFPDVVFVELKKSISCSSTSYI